MFDDLTISGGGGAPTPESPSIEGTDKKGLPGLTLVARGAKGSVLE